MRESLPNEIPGFSSRTFSRLSLAKNMYAERPRLGALGSAMPVSPRNWYIGRMFSSSKDTYPSFSSQPWAWRPCGWSSPWAYWMKGCWKASVRMEQEWPNWQDERRRNAEQDGIEFKEFKRNLRQQRERREINGGREGEEREKQRDARLGGCGQCARPNRSDHRAQVQE